MSDNAEQLHKAYPTTLEGKTYAELMNMACSYDTPFREHLLIAEEMKRRRNLMSDNAEKKVKHPCWRCKHACRFQGVICKLNNFYVSAKCWKYKLHGRYKRRTSDEQR